MFAFYLRLKDYVNDSSSHFVSNAQEKMDTGKYRQKFRCEDFGGLVSNKEISIEKIAR